MLDMLREAVFPGAHSDVWYNATLMKLVCCTSLQQVGVIAINPTVGLAVCSR